MSEQREWAGPTYRQGFGAKIEDTLDADIFQQFWEPRATGSLTDHQRHINLVTAMLGRAVQDATGKRLSGEQFKDAGHSNDVQRWAKNFFRHRHMEPFGWGWTIEILSLSEFQALAIERATLKNTTDIIDQAA